MSLNILEPPPGSDGLPARRLSDDLRLVLSEAAGRSLTIGELEDMLKGRGFALLITLFSLPFCTPIAIPGLSVPFGVVITFLGLRILFGRKPELPGFILRRQVRYSVLEKIVGIGLKLCIRIEKVAKPRMEFLRRWPGMINLIGLGLASGGIQLLLPLPLPLSNAIPAISVVLLTTGLIERDGIFVLAGYVVNLSAWLYFALMFGVLQNGLQHLLHHT